MRPFSNFAKNYFQSDKAGALSYGTRYLPTEAGFMRSASRRQPRSSFAGLSIVRAGQRFW